MPGPRPSRRRRSVSARNDIQQQLRINSLAIAAAQESQALEAAGDKAAAKKKAREALRLEDQAKYFGLARAAALEWQALTDAGQLKEAKKKAREAIKLESKWRRLGGTGNLFG